MPSDADRSAPFRDRLYRHCEFPQARFATAAILLLLFRQQRQKTPGVVIALRFGFLGETAQHTAALLVIVQGLGKQIFQRGAFGITGAVGIDYRPAAGFFR
jgi:hypothetical protein